VAYLESYEDQVHHPTEDLIFDRLKARTEKKRVAVETLEEQHKILADMTKTFYNSLEAIMHEGVVLRQQVESEGRAMVKLLRRHMDLEETEVFALAESSLSDADWKDLEERVPKVNDPVFGDPDPARFRTLFQHLTLELDSSGP
jgi:hemerythrin-like domain-containing protein